MAKARADVDANRRFQQNKRVEVTTLERLAVENTAELNALGGCRALAAGAASECHRHAGEIEALLARNAPWLAEARAALDEATRRIEAAEVRVFDHDRKRLDLELLLRDHGLL